GGLLDCGPACYLIARPLRGTLDLPAGTPSGAWNVWFSVALPDERVLEAPPVSLFIHERPAVRVVARRRTAVLELRESYTCRLSPLAGEGLRRRAELPDARRRAEAALLRYAMRARRSIARSHSRRIAPLHGRTTSQ